MPFTLRVATLNLRHNADRWPERLPLVVAGLEQERPHLVGLQEVFIPIDQAGAGDVRVTAARLAFDRPGAEDPGLYPSDHYGLIAEIAFPGDAGAGDPRGSAGSSRRFRQGAYCTVSASVV